MVRAVLYYMKSLRSRFFRLYWRGGFFKHVFMRLIALWIVNAVLFLVIANIVPVSRFVILERLSGWRFFGGMYQYYHTTDSPSPHASRDDFDAWTLYFICERVSLLAALLYGVRISGSIFRQSSFGHSCFLFGWAFGRVSRKVG